MVFRRIEDSLESAVEGTIGRIFRSELQPVEIVRRLIRAYDAAKVIDANGRLLGPNDFEVRLNPTDHERLSTMEQALARDCASRLRTHAREQGGAFIGAVTLHLLEDPSVRLGGCEVTGRFDESAGGTLASAWLELTDGTRIDLAPTVVRLGRIPESDIVLDDPNCSRRHAELHPDGDTFTLVDLGSTNGSRVNGSPVSRRMLVDGDELTFGVISATYRQA